MNVSLWNVFNALYCTGKSTCEYLWRAHFCPCAMGLKQSLLGMMEECLEGGWSFHILIGTAIPDVHFELLMFTRSIVYHILSTNKYTWNFQRGGKAGHVHDSRVIQSNLSLRPLMCLMCIWAVLFSFSFFSKILKGNRIMYGRKNQEAHWPSISSAHQFNFCSAVCPLVEGSKMCFDSTNS